VAQLLLKVAYYLNLSNNNCARTYFFIYYQQKPMVSTD
jgi:hypothetical protein